MAMKQTVHAVELEHVSKHFGPVQAVKNVSLVIESGEVVAFLGPNGAGKTTSISLMLGLRSPSSGRVALFGKDPRKAENRKRVGAMLQDASVPWMLSVRELVELFARLHEQSMDTRKAIQMAGLEDKVHARVSTLSGGQQQRVYFAMALVGNPDILFLDEPTTGLDVESRRNFWDQINDQIKRGKTIILTTHNLEEADALARRIVVIDRGEIVADGTPTDIKGHVGGKHVRFHAPALTLAELRALPGVQLAQELNGRFDLYSTLYALQKHAKACCLDGLPSGPDCDGRGLYPSAIKGCREYFA